MCELCNTDAITYDIPIVRNKQFGTYWLVQARKDGDYMKKGEFGITKKDNPFLLFNKNNLKDFSNFVYNITYISDINVMNKISSLVQACKNTYNHKNTTEEWLYYKILQVIERGYVDYFMWKTRKIKGFYEGRQYISVDGGDTFTPTNNIIISKNKKRFEEMLQERMRT